MGNCFRSGSGGDNGEQSEIASRLAETTELADAKYTALSTQLVSLGGQRKRILDEVTEIKLKEAKGVAAITGSIRTNKPIPIRFQQLHVRLQQLNNSMTQLDQNAASIHQFMQRIQLQRSTAASLNQQHEQSTMMEAWSRLTKSLGVSTDTVIQRQEELDSAVQDMDEIRQAVQFGVRDSMISSSGGGGIRDISELLAATDTDDVIEIDATAPVAAPESMWSVDSDDPTIELTSSKPVVRGTYASLPTGKRSVHELLGS